MVDPTNNAVEENPGRPKGQQRSLARRSARRTNGSISRKKERRINLLVSRARFTPN